MTDVTKRMFAAISFAACISLPILATAQSPTPTMMSLYETATIRIALPNTRVQLTGTWATVPVGIVGLVVSEDLRVVKVEPIATGDVTVTFTGSATTPAGPMTITQSVPITVSGRKPTAQIKINPAR